MKLFNTFGSHPFLPQISEGQEAQLSVKRIDTNEVRSRTAQGVQSCVTNPELSRILSQMLSVNIGQNRPEQLNVGESCLLAQYEGERIPEGAQTLPVNGRVNWFLITRK